MLDFKKIMNDIYSEQLSLATTQILKTYGFNDYYLKKVFKKAILEKEKKTFMKF